MRLSEGLALALLVSVTFPQIGQSAQARTTSCGVEWEEAALFAPAPLPGGNDSDASVTASLDRSLLSGGQVLPEEPRKEHEDQRRRRLFRTPAGAVVLIVVGSAIVGALALSTLDDD